MGSREKQCLIALRTVTQLQTANVASVASKALREVYKSRQHSVLLYMYMLDSYRRCYLVSTLSMMHSSDRSDRLCILSEQLGAGCWQSFLKQLQNCHLRFHHRYIFMNNCPHQSQLHSTKNFQGRDSFAWELSPLFGVRAELVCQFLPPALRKSDMAGTVYSLLNYVYQQS